MNILFIKICFVLFMVSEIPIVSVFGHCPCSVTIRYPCLNTDTPVIYGIKRLNKILKSQ